MSLGQTFFQGGDVFMHMTCIRCKVKNKVSVNALLAKKTPPLCGKCKKNLIEQEDVDEIVANIHPDELKPDPVNVVLGPDSPGVGPAGCSDPEDYDIEEVIDDEEDWVI